MAGVQARLDREGGPPAHQLCLRSRQWQPREIDEGVAQGIEHLGLGGWLWFGPQQLGG